MSHPNKHTSLLTAIALTLAIAGSTASIALATESLTNDTTEFRMRTAAGAIEKVRVANLQPGQVLNLTTDAGTPVVVGHHENGYVIDLVGERFEVDAPEIGEIEQHIVHRQLEGVHTHDQGDHDDGKVIRKIVRIKDKDVQAGDGSAPKQERKVVVVKHGGEHDGALSEDISVMLGDLALDEGGVPEGKRIVVVRKLEKQKTQP